MEKFITEDLVNSLNSGDADGIKKNFTELMKMFLNRNPELSNDINWVSKFSSKVLLKLLTNLDNEDKLVRQLILMSLIILLQNEQAKIHFMDRCGLPMNPGKLLLNRVKNLREIYKD